MKANELMIGDWMQSTFMGNNVPCKVVGISTDITIEYQNCARKYEALKAVEPIPLTAEILETNGFNIEVAPYTPNWLRCILNPNFFLEDRLKGFYHFNGNNLAKIQYVHELQHTLKLCGIDKNIEL